VDARSGLQLACEVLLCRLNVASASDSINGNWSYSYDDFNRLSTSCQPTSSCPGSPTLAFTYLYDQFGNRWHQNASGQQGQQAPQPNYTFDTHNRISNPDSLVTYDAAGNETNDGFHQYTYDAEGRVVQIDNDTSWVVYDAFGNRVEENLGAGVTDWVYGFSERPIWGFTAANQNSGGLRSEIYAGNVHLATYANNRTYFDYGDGVGSLRTHTSTVPLTPNDLCLNLPFGDGLNCAGSSPNPVHFTGQALDPHGLTHLMYRDLSTTQGRWVVPDPAGMSAADPTNPQSWNRYSYVLNNPMSAADPDGLDCVYLNNAGDGVESIDQNSNPEECGSNGGYWVNGGVTSAQINSEAGTVDLTGTTNGVDNNTSSHYQDSGMSSPPLWQGISDWYQHFINDWNRRIDAHRPPPQRPSTLDPLQYINNIMMGAVPVFPSAGSTGRTAPANLKEQLAMEQVKANPGGKRLPLQMNDATLARKPRLGQNE